LDRRIKKVLLVEDDDVQRAAVVELIGADDVEIVAVADAEEALKVLDGDTFDCMVLDLSLPGMDGIQLVQELREKSRGPRLPIIVYTGRDLTKEERLGLSQLAETVIIKDVRSPERLVEEASLFLHRPEASMPEGKRKILRSLVHGDPALQGKHVLVVDDDVRNIFAITAVLEQHDIVVDHAENGQEALDKLAELETVEAVLMDVMMPEMDGYEAMRRIRKNPAWKSLPIIALTAKAMKGDREKCVEAGASDYVTKPVDEEQLISLLRVWLYR
jgi:CheY-like chemotaxis protein